MNKEDIYRLLPENLKKYKNLSNITKVVANTIENKISLEIEKLSLYKNINFLDDKVLDQLAWQWNVEFYSSELPKDKKIAMIKQSYFHHIKKGTVKALETAVKSIVKDVEVKEWYEHGGVPYTFRLIVEGEMLTADEIETVHKMANIYRNVRSHLDGFIISKKNNSLMTFSGALCEHKRIINKFRG